LATLLGGALLGFRAAAGGAAGRFVAGSLAAALLPAFPIAFESRRPPITPRPSGTGVPPTFTIIIAARDEAAVLPQVIADLGAQDHRSAEGRPFFELIVVDDRSTDGTPQAALRASAAAGLGGVTRLIRRAGSDLPDGKGAALTAVPADACHGDLIVVLDADARVGPTFLSTLAGYAAAGAEAITCRRRIIGADRSILAGAQADEQTVDGEIQRGRWALGGCSEFRGNGIVVRRELLAAVGGWRAEALTEDLDLSSRVAAQTGGNVAWAIEAEVREEPVHTWSELWQQRVRWAEGAVRRALEHGPALLRSERLAPVAKLDFAAYMAQLGGPPLMIGALAGALATGRKRVALALLAAYCSAAAGLCFDALRWEIRPDGSPL
jgi:cellulose synthase/poly-beta-1,6-N-acetylglucosamine synthase-like glycosyltransferase